MASASSQGVHQLFSRGVRFHAVSFIRRGFAGGVTSHGVRIVNNRYYNLTNVGDKTRSFSTTSSVNMRFVQFTAIEGGPQRLGVQLSHGGDVIDVSGVDSSIPNSMVKFLARGPAVLEKAKRFV
jgi:hypothetical protein